MATAIGIGGFVFTAGSFLRSACALGCRAGRRPFGLPLATIGAHYAIMYFASTTVRLASVTRLAEQLNIRSFARAAAGIRSNVIILQIKGAAATLTHASISREHQAFCCL